jgi:uncharacterized YccA/Bax inhibitor family protein
MNALVSVLAQLDPAEGEVTAAEQIRNAATLTSITLAVLSAFANQRAGSLAVQRSDLGKVTAKNLRRDLFVDTALTGFGVLLLIAAGPLFFTAVGEATPLLQTETALFVLFCLFYIGVGFVVLWVGVTARARGVLLKKKTVKDNLLPALHAAGL